MNSESLAVVAGIVLGIGIVVLILTLIMKKKKQNESIPVSYIDKLTSKDLKNIVERKMKE